MVNLFGRRILLFVFAYAGGDPPPNQIVLLDNTEHTRNGVANTFIIRETHTAHGRKMHPSFEDFITKIFDLVRRHIFLLALGVPCFAHGCCLSLSLTRHPPVAILMEKCTGTIFFIRYENIGYHNCFPVYEKKHQPSAAVVFLNNNFFLSFSFFLQSLFAPLNGIQQLEDISDTHYQFFLPAFCALRAQFLCDTALLTWQFCLGTLALTTGSLRPKIGGNKFPPLHFIPS
jgi:hypothetical protein